MIGLLDECEITREDLTESMESFKFPGVKRHSYSELDSKAKTAFTRMYDAHAILVYLHLPVAGSLDIFFCVLSIFIVDAGTTKHPTSPKR